MSSSIIIDEQAPIACHPELGDYKDLVKNGRVYSPETLQAAILHALITVASELRYMRYEGVPVDKILPTCKIHGNLSCTICEEMARRQQGLDR